MPSLAAAAAVAVAVAALKALCGALSKSCCLWERLMDIGADFTSTGAAMYSVGMSLCGGDDQFYWPCLCGLAESQTLILQLAVSAVVAAMVATGRRRTG